MAGEYQFSLIDVTKQQGTKTILKDVCLSFFYGAHIGVIGANGAGKSSLLKILHSLCTQPYFNLPVVDVGHLLMELCAMQRNIYNLCTPIPLISDISLPFTPGPFHISTDNAHAQC